MKAVIAVAVVVVAAIVIGGIMFLRRQPSPDSAGFQEFVQNPEMLDLWERRLKEREKYVEEAANWSDDQIAANVKHVLFETETSKDVENDMHALKKLGPRAHAAIERHLRDQSLYATLVKPTGDNLGPESPFERACELFDDQPPESVLAPIEPFLSDPSEDIRKSAAFVIAKTGAAAAVPLVEHALNDSDEQVRTWALIGISYALDNKRIDAATKSGLFDCVHALLKRGENGHDAVDRLYRLDPEKATSYLLSDDVLSLDCEFLQDAMEVLAKHNVPAPRDRLVALIDQLDVAEIKYPRTYQLANGIWWLGKLQNPADRPRLEQLLAHADERVAERAAAGMLALQGLDGFDEKIWKKIESHGFQALNTPQQQFVAVYELDGEVRNGGFSQYFFNSSGDHWRLALAGLEAMKFKDRLEIVRQALSRFPQQQPDEDRDRRMQQLSKLATDDEELFSKLETKYYGSKEVLDVVIMRYVLSHADDFK